MVTYNTVSVTGNNIFGNSSGEVVNVRFTPASFYFDTVNNTEINAPVATATSNNAGAWTVSGIIDPTPAGTGLAWNLTVSDKGTGQVLYTANVQVAFANGASQQWLALTPPPPPATTTTYLVTPGAVPGAAGQFLTSFAANSNVLAWNYGVNPLNVLNFQADPTGVTDSTAAINNAIAAATGNAAPATHSRTPTNAIYLPTGTYKITADLLIQSVVGFHFYGDGPELTILNASGTGFTTAVLNVDGSYAGRYEGFTLKGDTTEQVTNGINLTWTTAANRSTTGNKFQDIRIRNLNFVTGFSMAGITNRQVDSTRLDCIVIGGQQVVGSWSNSGNWQKGFEFGNGTFANIYDQVLTRCDASNVYYGYYNNVSSFSLNGAQPANNFCDFYISPGAQTTVTNIQSQNSGQFIICPSNFSPQPVTFNDCQFKSNFLSTANSNAVITLSGGQFNINNFSAATCQNPSGGVYVGASIAITGASSSRPCTANFVNLSLFGARTSLFILSRAIVNVTGYNNYNPNTGNYTYASGDVASFNQGGNWTNLDSLASASVFFPAAYGAVGNGTTDDTTALQNCFAAAITAQGIVDFGALNYKTTSPITINGAVKMRGSAGSTKGGIVNAASDIFTVSGSANTVTVASCVFTSNSGGGHIFNASGANISDWTFLGNSINQNNAAKSIWYQYQGGMFDFVADENNFWQCAGAASVPAVQFLAMAGNCNSIKFGRGRYVGGSTMSAPFFAFYPDSGAHTDTNVGFSSGSPTVTDANAVAADVGLNIYHATFSSGVAAITAVNPGVGYTVSKNAGGNLSAQTALIGIQGWYEEIKFDHCTFELMPAGAIWGNGIYDIAIDDVACWDITATSDVYHFYKGNTAYTCQDISVRGGRGGAVTGGANNFFADSNCINVLLESFGQGWGAAPVISSPAGQTTIINGVVANNGVTPGVQIPGITSPSVTWITATGNTTYNVPAGATIIEVFLLAGGGGGGSGAMNSASATAGGGSGGAGGAYGAFTFRASDLTSPITVSVGAGGTGGTAVSSNGSGNPATNNAGNTSFGPYAWVHAGAIGTAGTNAAGGAAGSGAAPGLTWGGLGGNGGGSNTGGSNGASTTGTLVNGGGGGGGTNTTATAGGTTQIPPGGSNSNQGIGGTALGVAATAGTQPSAAGIPSCGGGGGFSATSGAAGQGATAFYGGGGGGGGGCAGGTSSGAGGNGGPGFALIIAHFA